LLLGIFLIRALFGYLTDIMVKCNVLRIEGNTMSAKKETELQSFIDNVNKKDKLNGKKVIFNFVKRKRK
jgi:hypothetical protein